MNTNFNNCTAMVGAVDVRMSVWSNQHARPDQ